MSVQLEITGAPALAPPDVKLRARQRFALELIERLQPVSSDELGAALHEYRSDHGGKGHDADARCSYCGSEGSQMGRALRKHGLVTQKRGLGWALVGWRPEPAGAGPGDLPESF